MKRVRRLHLLIYFQIYKKKVLISKRFYIRKELYIAYLLDRGAGGPVIVASSKGGVDIEKVAEETPTAIVKV